MPRDEEKKQRRRYKEAKRRRFGPNRPHSRDAPYDVKRWENFDAPPSAAYRYQSEVAYEESYRYNWEKPYYGERHPAPSRLNYGPQRTGYGWSTEYGERLPENFWEVPGPYRGFGPRNYRRSDKAITEDVCERLTWHGQIDARNMDVETENGEVTLAGTVSSRAQKRMAEDTADTVLGVRDVHNRLRIVSGPPRREQLRSSGVYPASGPFPPEDAEVEAMGDWGRPDKERNPEK